MYKVDYRVAGCQKKSAAKATVKYPNNIRLIAFGRAITALF